MLPDGYSLEPSTNGRRYLISDEPVYRSVPKGQEPIQEYPVRRVASIPPLTPHEDIVRVARLDKRSRDMTLPPVEREEALQELAEVFGED